MVQRYEQKRRLQWYKRGAAYRKGEGWVKGGEGLSQPFTSHNPSVYRGFRRKGEG